MDEELLDTLKRLARAIAAQFGPNCEVVVHDLTGGDPENTIALIENGHVSNRSVGRGSSHIALEAIKAIKAEKPLADHYDYLTKTADGRILRSGTVHQRFLRKARGHLLDQLRPHAADDGKIRPGFAGQERDGSGEPERIPRTSTSFSTTCSSAASAHRQARRHDEQGRQGARHTLPKRRGRDAHHKERRQDRLVFQHQQIHIVFLSRFRRQKLTARA